jgi:hypothetical protein
MNDGDRRLTLNMFGRQQDKQLRPKRSRGSRQDTRYLRDIGYLEIMAALLLYVGIANAR